MDIEHTHDQLYVAMRTLLLLDMPLSDRLYHGYVRKIILSIDLHNFPHLYQETAQEIFNFFNNINEDSSIDDNTAGYIIEKILNLYSDILIYIGQYKIKIG